MPESSRAAWAARFLAVVLIIVFAFLFWNLYSTLVTLRQEASETGPAATTSDGPTASEQ